MGFHRKELSTYGQESADQLDQSPPLLRRGRLGQRSVVFHFKILPNTKVLLAWLQQQHSTVVNYMSMCATVEILAVM